MLLEEAARRLPDSDTARLDAELLLCHCLGRRREAVHARLDEAAALTAQARFMSLVAERQRGVPVAYLTGRREFWSLELQVSPATLIPRPDTELLVEQAVLAIRRFGFVNVLDLGTGSGAVALAIASEFPECRLLGVDCSAQALAVAQRNATRLGLSNVRLRVGDWYVPVSDIRFDLIVANPPYVADDDPVLEHTELQFEPAVALRGGPDGLSAIRTILAGADRHLRRGAMLILEHGSDQGAPVRALFARHGLHDIVTLSDLGGRERVTAGLRRAV